VIRQLQCLLLAALMLAGCADTFNSIRETTTGWVSDKGKADAEVQPTELAEDFVPTIEVQELWSEQAGKGAEELYLKLLPAVEGTSVYTADRDGRVISLDVASGKQQWEVRDKDRRISGGPGVGDGKVFVGTSEAEVVARAGESGQKLWVAKVSSEVLAAPRAADGVVVVRSGDGNVYALDTESGMEKWVYDRTIPTLTLRGTAAPTLHDGVAYVGFENGRLVALDLATGAQLWEAELAQASGRSDLERLVDIDGEPVIRDGTAYLGSYQGRVAAISLEGGSIEWTRDMSTYDNVAVDEERVYITDERGVVWALDRYDGSAKWRNRELRYRRLTGPTHFKHYVVVGDFEGYLHWLDAETGKLVARSRVDKERILTPPLDLGDSLLGYSSSGKIAAFRAD